MLARCRVIDVVSVYDHVFLSVYDHVFLVLITRRHLCIRHWSTLPITALITQRRRAGVYKEFVDLGVSQARVLGQAKVLQLECNLVISALLVTLVHVRQECKNFMLHVRRDFSQERRCRAGTTCRDRDRSFKW